MTNQWTDVRLADVIMICGSNAAENHPISFKWVDAAMSREKNPAKLIVVDPRFTRTAARASIYAPIRPGTDIVFFGGLINYALSNNAIQKVYLDNYTNASFLVNPAYKFDEATGLFSGYNKDKKKYDVATWAFQYDKIGPDGKPTADAKPLRDPSLQSPQTVYQILKKHYSRYTPDKVAAITGMPVEKFNEIAEVYCSTSDPAKSGTLLYAMGLCQHTIGTQNIRAFAILQLLLGNMGVAGGGINALRGESNVQSSTDFALLSHLVPGYIAMPNSTTNPTLNDWITKFIASKGTGSFWANSNKFIISMLKGFWTDNATAANEYGYQWYPKVKDGVNYTHMALFEAMYSGTIKGLMLWGQNPAAGGPNVNMEASALEKLDWMVALDLWETETSVFWKRPGAKTGDIKTEVFLLPVAASIEKEGTVTNSGRVIQWRYKAVAPPGEAKSDGTVVNLLFNKLLELYKKDGGPNAEAITKLYWPYGKEEPNSEDVLKEINGFTWPDKKQVANFTKLAADGSTVCGNWIFSGVFAPDAKDPQKTVKNFSKRTDNTDVGNVAIYPLWAFAWPVNRRIIYNRCSADPSGQPWNPAKTLVKWDGAKWVTIDVPDFKATDTALPTNPPVAPSVSAANAYLMQPWGMGHLFAPTGLADGPLAEHYEPIETLFKNAMSGQQSNPAAKIMTNKDNPDVDKLAAVGDPNYPIIGTTWRVTEHWQTGQMTRNLPWLAEMQPEMFVEMSVDLAKRKGVSNGDWVKIKSIRGEVEAVALVTDRVQPLTIGGKQVDFVGMPWHYGYSGYITGGPNGKNYSANQLTPHVGDANTSIPEYKAFIVDIEKA
jgi:formate dehydrogenase major subunit